MPRSSLHRAGRGAASRGRRSRHGRGARGPVTGPQLPILHGRIDRFEFTVASTVDYLRGLWPDELAGVRFEVAAAPPPPIGPDGVERWRVYRHERRVIFYRLPIMRFARLHRDDELHRQLLVEGCVFRAVGELLGRDPWELAPERFRP